MNRDDAYSLASFINDNSNRFAAAVLDIGRECWLVAVDNAGEPRSAERARYMEPIANFEQYLTRPRRIATLEEEYRDLLSSWKSTVGRPV